MQKTLDYLYGLQRFGMKLGLETMSKLMEALDNPHKKFKSVHIAGTNGKGSTAAFLASCLKEGGYKTGLYTSPHLVQFNERIQINNKLISDEEIVELTKLIKNKIEEHDIPVTFFEFTTALAFLYFADKVDIAVIEVGLGGRLDATNILTPLVSVITSIGHDHEKHLGNNIVDIAREKAGIIKETIPVVCAGQDPQVIQLLNEICNERKTQINVIGYKKIEDQIFEINNKNYTISLRGDFQLENAALAVLTLNIVQNRFNISKEDIKSGLTKTIWPGRIDIIQQNPTIILDGAHNVCGMEELRNYLKKFNNKKILVLGIKEDKNSPEMISVITPIIDEIIVTESNYNPTSVDQLEQECKKHNGNITKEKNPKKALELAQKISKKEDMIIVAGSLYLIGDIIKFIPSMPA